MNKNNCQLETIIWELTRKCNLRCWHCSNNSGNPLKNELNLQEIEGLFRDISSLDIKELRLYGGEPLISPIFEEILEHAKRYKLPISLYTNAVLLNNKNIKLLLDAKINRVYISIDGSNKKSHDSLRNSPGNFNILLNRIDMLKRYKFTIIVNFTINRFNYNEIFSTYKLLKNKGVNKIQANVIMKLGRAKNNWNKLSLSLEETKKVAKRIKIVEKKLFSKDVVRRGCDAGVNTIYINADGEIYPCALLIEKKFSAGNIKNNSILDIINNTKNKYFNEIKKINEEKSFCPECNLKDKCLGGCRTRAYCAYGSFIAPDPASCLRNKGSYE